MCLPLLPSLESRARFGDQARLSDDGKSLSVCFVFGNAWGATFVLLGAGWMDGWMVAFSGWLLGLDFVVIPPFPLF